MRESRLAAAALAGDGGDGGSVVPERERDAVQCDDGLTFLEEAPAVHLRDGTQFEERGALSHRVADPSYRWQATRRSGATSSRRGVRSGHGSKACGQRGANG